MSQSPTTRALDALAFTSLWVAAAAGVLAAAASRAMGVAVDPAVVGLAGTGTLVIYTVDRLRDLPRDRATSPQRAAFVERHSTELGALGVVAAVTAIACGWLAGPRAIGVALLVLPVGLLHRRLKHFAYGKALYITLAWVAVVVGVPAAAGQGAQGIPLVGLCIAASIFANAIASNVRDDEAAAARIGHGPALATARITAALGIAVALLAPPPVRPLAAVPGLTLVALLLFRPGERYGLLAVDGALIAGGLLALAMGGSGA